MDGGIENVVNFAKNPEAGLRGRNSGESRYGKRLTCVVRG